MKIDEPITKDYALFYRCMLSLVVLILILSTTVAEAHDGGIAKNEVSGTFITKVPSGFTEAPNLYTYPKQNQWSNFASLGGWAELRGVEESPEIGAGVGRVVLMTIRHKNSYIFEMKIGPRGPPITVTGYHPIYSQTRGGWTKVEELREGEELRTQDAKVDLSRIERVIGSQVVYNIEVESDNRYYVGESRVLVHNANCKEATAPRSETIVRRMNAEEAAATVDARGLVPKPGSRGAKWVSTDKPQASLQKRGHEKTVTMEVEPGTQKWLDSQAVDFMDVPGEASLPGGVLKKTNEPGGLGVGVDLLGEFNSRVKKVTVE